MLVAARSGSQLERKIISISTKRQITIPQRYFEALGFDNEAECILQDGGVFIRPVRDGGNEFAAEILADLIAQGFSGTELLEKFKEASQKVRPAVERMIDEADKLAKHGSATPLEDLFGVEGE